MKMVGRLGMALALSAALAACQQQPPQNGRDFGIQQPAVKFSVSTPAQLALESTYWQLVKLGADAPAPTERAISLFLLQGKVSGYGGCNLFSGRYEFDYERLVFPQLAAANLPCTAKGQERTVFQTLEQSHYWHINQDNRHLYLLDSSGNTLMEWKVTGE